MILQICGGCGEHGRNSFLIKGDGVSFLLDAGKGNGGSLPDFPLEAIPHLDALFLSHSHADHSGAIPFLRSHGFQGPVIATAPTLAQLPFDPGKTLLIHPEENRFKTISFHGGRSGHCIGSVWLFMSIGERTLFYSGDYHEGGPVYRCDAVRDVTAGLAIVDAAYGSHETTVPEAEEAIITIVKDLLSTHPSLLMPVPKHGRGLDMIRLLSSRLPGVPLYADATQLAELHADPSGFWSVPFDASPQVYQGMIQPGVTFVSDPQLATAEGRQASVGIPVLFTGTIDPGSFAEKVRSSGQGRFQSYPVHQGIPSFQRLKAVNAFTRVIPFHSAELPVSSPIVF